MVSAIVAVHINACASHLTTTRKANDPKVDMLELDVVEVKRASSKAAAAATSAAPRAKEIAKLSRDMSDTKAASQREALETEITDLMGKLAADVSDAEAQADKAEKVLARHAIS